MFETQNTKHVVFNAKLTEVQSKFDLIPNNKSTTSKTARPSHLTKFYPSLGWRVIPYSKYTLSLRLPPKLFSLHLLFRLAQATALLAFVAVFTTVTPVSYTHLDVYKRQA